MKFEDIKHMASEVGAHVKYFAKGTVDAYYPTGPDNVFVEIFKKERSLEGTPIEIANQVERYEASASIPTSMLLAVTGLGVIVSGGDMLTRGITPENSLLMGTSVVYNPATHWGIRDLYHRCKAKIKHGTGLENSLER
ncbi:MAG TPA: hypothetical protein ENN30_01785 [Candidatus Woesearchaeota archaeon]|nr:hypothetical protein [Candidatus Woesearchaeota archaeon]